MLEYTLYIKAWNDMKGIEKILEDRIEDLAEQRISEVRGLSGLFPRIRALYFDRVCGPDVIFSGTDIGYYGENVEVSIPTTTIINDAFWAQYKEKWCKK